jgi:hypothetical protein
MKTPSYNLPPVPWRWIYFELCLNDFSLPTPEASILLLCLTSIYLPFQGQVYYTLICGSSFFLKTSECIWLPLR